MMGISVVVCCYNSESRVPKVLEYLLAQKVDSQVQWEVLLVDNASTDRTAEVARQMWNRPGVELKVVNEPIPGLSNARKRGMNSAKFEIVSLVDDDNWVEPSWVQKVYDHFLTKPGLGLLGGRGEVVCEGEKPFWFDRFQAAYAVGPQNDSSGYVSKPLYGAGIGLRKDVWFQIVEKGFEFVFLDRKGSSLSSGGDSELCYAFLLAGYQVYYDDDLHFFHYMPAGRLTWDYLKKLMKAFGRTQPVLKVYESVLRNYTGMDRFKYESRWLAILQSFYSMSLGCLHYARVGWRPVEGSHEAMGYIYVRQTFIERFLLFPSFPSIVSKIRNGKWRFAS